MSIDVRLLPLWAFVACSRVKLTLYKGFSIPWSVYTACEAFGKHSNFYIFGSNTVMLGNILLNGIFLLYFRIVNV